MRDERLKISNILRKSKRGNSSLSKTDNEGPQYEICVYCGVTTNVLVGLSIDCRKNYVRGCGQLCEKCASALERGKSTPFRQNQ